MDYKNYATIFKVLSDPNRLKILMIIHEEKKVCVCRILEQFDITQPTFSYHMRALQDAGLVSCEKKGTLCYYELNCDKINQIKHFLGRLS